ncbi:aldo/keto reductase [Litoreibacter roseus]|uniref:Aldo/keto reductase n=1 Tax=Litoreibacter roseus TaxID=2601869 RepID=A0A6N6JB25_9RHOB|nr:aldo/keto reductase [Litoreibacter roseus]GFE63375.1 aldo/keto reductase [Litoreibacter roseus]
MTQMTTRTGAPASPLCFGTMQFGGTADETASRGMYDACRSVGVNFFDTAHVYTEGRSETLLGTFCAGEVDDVIIATKAGYEGGASRANILKTFDESCKRLKMDRVDLFYMHRWDADTPLEETLETLASLKAQGLIRYVGVSNYAAWQVMKAIRVAASFDLSIDVLQPMYSLVKRQAEVEILPMCADQGVAVCPYSPLGGGLLTGKYAAGGGGRLIDDHRYAARYDVEWMHNVAAELPKIAKAHGTTAATLAVAWAGHHPAVTAPIISARSVEQLAPSLAALDFNMTDALYAEITALSQAPAPATDRLEEA